MHHWCQSKILGEKNGSISSSNSMVQVYLILWLSFSAISQSNSLTESISVYAKCRAFLQEVSAIATFRRIKMKTLYHCKEAPDGFRLEQIHRGHHAAVAGGFTGPAQMPGDQSSQPASGKQRVEQEGEKFGGPREICSLTNDRSISLFPAPIGGFSDHLDPGKESCPCLVHPLDHGEEH